MSLSVGIGARAELSELDPEGLEWLLEDLAAVNAVLRANDLPEHDEPEQLPPHTDRAALGSFPYSWLHGLRRLYALILHNAGQPGWQPAPMPGDYEVGSDPLIDEELTIYMRSHLIVHSDAEGFYVPVDFDEPLLDDPDTGALPGAILGSSQRLLAELRAVAPWLGIALDPSGGLDDDSAGRIDNTPDGDPWQEEKLTWLALFEAARLSTELRTAIVFR